MTAEGIAARVQARPAGSGRWHGKCPVHRGKSATSLSIATGEAGRVLIHCFAGCTVESICAEMGLKVSDLFSEPGAYQPKSCAVREAEKQISDLRGRLTKREQVLPVTIVYVDRDHVDEGLARALALAIEGEIVQAILEPTR